MRNWLGVFLIVLFAVSSVQAYSRPAGESGGHYDTVIVSQGETVWTIAARYTSAKEDIRNRIAAIREINGLDGNGHIFVGQRLKVPLKN